jgi:hypothetical protein
VRGSASALLLSAALVAAAAAPATAQGGPREIRAERIAPHLAFLADDLLEGRAPGTRGGRTAARYIATQLALAGVEPVRGSYYQAVPLVGWRADPGRTTLEFAVDGRRTTLRHPTDAVVWVESGADSAAVSGELVFVGYGTRAPEYEWDDFKGRDLSGRILVALINDPPAPPGQPLIFEGAAMTYYGRWTYKIEEAARQGAAAVLIVHSTQTAGYPWSVVEASFAGERLALPRDSVGTPTLALQGWLAFDAARRLLAGAGLDIDELFVRAARRDFQPVFTGINARIRAGGTARRFQSSNVLGMVSGSHETRRDEAIVYTAHYDGLGIGTPVDGDSIYNGAYDNASGVALLLEIAGAFARHTPRPNARSCSSSPRPRRPVCSAPWYVRRPIVPLQRTVAALNIDGANLWGETERCQRRNGTRTIDARHRIRAPRRRHGTPRRGRARPERDSSSAPITSRSPALASPPSIDHGTDYRSRPPGWGDANVLVRYETERYHQPADRYDPAFDLVGAVQQGRHAFLVGLDIANTAEPPRWHAGQRITDPSGGR